MHISDGVLPTSVAIGSFAVTCALAAWSVKQLKADEFPKTAVVTSAFFVASLIHVPLGATSVHLLFPGLVGILLGPAAFISIVIGVTLQSILFQFGGLTAIGANALMMGIPALICGGIFRLCRKQGAVKKMVAAAAFCGSLGTLLSAVGLALFLLSAGEHFRTVAQIALAAHLPVFLIEGVVSAGTVSFLARVKPEMLQCRL